MADPDLELRGVGLVQRQFQIYDLLVTNFNNGPTLKDKLNISTKKSAKISPEKADYVK